MAVPLVLGCSQSSDPGSGRETATEISQVSTKNLPALAEYLPPLDDGRIELAGPVGWHPVPRSGKFLARFKRKTDEQYPTIIATAKDSQSVDNVDRSNVQEFAARLAEETGAKNMAPLIIGRFVGAAYRTYGKEKGKTSQILDCLRLVTVVDGRQYTLELRAREGELDESRERLFSVANGTRFLAGGGPAAGFSATTDVATAEAEKKGRETPVAQSVESVQESEAPMERREDIVKATGAAEGPAAHEAAEEPTREADEESKPSTAAKGKIDLDKELEGLLDP